MTRRANRSIIRTNVRLNTCLERRVKFLSERETNKLRAERLKKKNRIRVRVRRSKQKKRFLLMGSMVLFLSLIGLLTGKNATGNFGWNDWSSGRNDFQSDMREDAPGPEEHTKDKEPPTAADRTVDSQPLEEQLIVTYLDVGQADCTILQCGGHAMMIDGGGQSTEGEVLASVRQLGITQFDYIVATHSHEDHIGGLCAVLDEFPVQTVLFRREDNDSKIYQEFQAAVEKSGAAVMVPEPGICFSFGDAKVWILAPEETVLDKTNNCSIALMITFGERKFLFTGDAEEESEKRMLELGLSLEADVFQAGHHGSQTSNSEAFLLAVDPVYVVISCGAGNEYGHPHSEVVARFEEMDIQIYRTDTMGTVTIKTDGNVLDIATERK